MSPIQEKILELQWVCCVFISLLAFWAGVALGREVFFVWAGIFGVLAAAGFAVFVRISR